MADAPYRIPAGHVGGGRFAKKGTIGEAIIRAAKSVYHGFDDAELDAERLDLTESIDHAATGKAAAAERLAQQIARSTAAYGERRQWPGDSEHAVRRIEDEIAQFDKRIADAHEAVSEIDAVAASRRPDTDFNDVVAPEPPAVPEAPSPPEPADPRPTRTVYHLTDSAKFKPNPKKVPADNAVSIRQREAAGLYVAKDQRDVERWVNGSGYLRPFVAEMDVPEDIINDERWAGEGFIPADRFDDVTVKRVIPIDAFSREVYGDYGWVEDTLGSRFDDGTPIPTRFADRYGPDATGKVPKGWRYEGPDARDMTAAEVKRLRDGTNAARKARSSDKAPSSNPFAPDFNDLVGTQAEDAARAITALRVNNPDLNAVALPTLPAVADGHRFADQPLPADTQRLALDDLFQPSVPSPVAPLAVTDTGTGPIRSVALNVDTGEVVGSHGPNAAPSYGRWVNLPADHPQAAHAATAGWLASPATQRYIDTAVLPALRNGTEPDGRYPGLVDAARRQADSLLDDYRGDAIPVRRVNTDLGTYYVEDPDGPFTIDGDTIHYADWEPDGTLRLWANNDLAQPRTPPADPFAEIDYAAADDPSLPWGQRVAALADARTALQRILGPDPSTLFSTPTEDDLADLVFSGQGGEREMAVLAAYDRFGESLDALVADRAASIAGQPDRAAIVEKLRSVPGFPPALADFLESQPWDTARTSAMIPPRPGAPAGGGMLDIRFPNDPESRVVLFTSVRGDVTARVAWEFSPDYQIAHPDEFADMPPNGSIEAAAGHLPYEWYSDVADPHNIARPGDNPPSMQAWIDTMEALGIDMGTDPTIRVQPSRNYGGRDYRPIGDAATLADADPDLAANVDIALRPFPKAWTETLADKTVQVVTDRDTLTGTSGNFTSDTPIIDIPSLTEHPEFSDAGTHEFAHLFERTVQGLMLIETWHFIQRLRREAAEREDLAVWQWNEREYGYSDHFGIPYMGRIYRSPFTYVEGVTAMAGHEIFSTVSQTLWGHEDRNRPDLDPEARRLLMALLATHHPRRHR